MKKLIGLYLFVFLFVFTIWATEADGKAISYESMSVDEMFTAKEYKNGELLLKFKDSVNTHQKKQLLNENGLTEKSKLVDGKIILVSTKSAGLKELVTKLKANSLLEFVELNYVYNSTYIPPDPNYKDQWYLPKINAPYAWNETKGNGQVTVAVIDTGVDIQHADLKGKIVKPYNAVTGSRTFYPDDHGTHVAGIIAATMNKTGIAGVAPQVKLMPINVFSGRSAASSDVIHGIAYAVNNGSDIINLSLGGYGYDFSFNYAVNYASNKGVVIVAAAGNDDTALFSYPAAYDEVISVSAINKNDRITDFSNYGSYIDVSAPGEEIYSTIPYNKYNFMDGTSMSAPIVSGVTALVLSKNPYLSSTQVKNILFSSTVDLGSKGWDQFYGYGRVDANKALKYTPIPMKEPVLSTKKFVMSGKNSVTMSVNVAGSITGSVYIVDEKGKRVRMLIDNKTPSKGKFSTYWDGKNDSGQYVQTGNYKIMFRMTNGKRAMSKSASIHVTDNVIPSIELPQSKVTFSPIASPQKLFSFKLNKKATVSASVYDSSGKLIKTLVKSKIYNGGNQTVQWDGKNAKGQYVRDGAYKIIFDGYSGNQKAASKQIMVNVDTTAPKAEIKLSSGTVTFDETVKNIGTVVISESGTLNVFVQGEDGQKHAILLGFNTSQRTNTIQWNGKLDNMYIPNGYYTVIVETQDAYGNKATFKGGTFTAVWDVSKLPILTVPSVVWPNSGDQSYVEVFYQTHQDAAIMIEIYDFYNNLIKTISKNEYKLAGVHRFEWDGLAEGDYSTYPPYKYVITAVKNGKTETKAGLITYDADPASLQEITYSLNEGNYYPIGLNLNFNTTEKFLLTITLENNDSILHTKMFTIQKGSSTITYTKPAQYQNDYYYYAIELKDVLGNKYHYYIEE